MLVLKCKMCGGDIAVSEDKTYGICEYCGSAVTLPKVDSEQRAAAFNRGNYFRRIGEFDQALAVYERIVREDDSDAEAHWCCALCRFGIEYVEDPNTYEWIPTCHRTSFDSILDDVDYKAAVEHSDGITQRQYQKEAVKIAEVQKGILATSQTAEPFDIFISYKETDETGNRTKDSVLAQDIYYQLTEQGYRVFFSRITLEEVVGKQYEPYIFAALNSAKVMIVVGTQEKYLNAPWVKNEWSRFLIMMKHDRTKVILPCYRDMDPYDLPEQLSVLQSYDMSKIGFIQELTRGILKIFGAEKQPVPEKEQVIVQQTNNSNAGALVERGYIVLEDREWEKADDFFEQALNQDAKNANAYFGKFLAQMKVVNLEEFIQKRKDLYWKTEAEELQIEEDSNFIVEMLNRYVIPSFLEESEILEELSFDRRYYSTVKIRRKRCEEEKLFWETEKNLVRAVKFANEEIQKRLKDAYDEIMAYLNHELKEAEEKQQLEFEQLSLAYKGHLQSVKAKIDVRYENLMFRQKVLYQSACSALRKVQEEIEKSVSTKRKLENRIEREETYIQQLSDVKEDFMSLGDYLDSIRLLQTCELLQKECEDRIIDIKQKAEEKEKIKSVIGFRLAWGILVLMVILCIFAQ